jgi:NAD(P)H-nitrite reductase large subunit
MLRRIADVAEKFGATLKCTSGQRIAILGLREQDVDGAWADLGGCRPGHISGSVVRNIRACPGTQFCKRARQNSLAVGMELDRLYHGRKLPGKLKIGVSGCGNQCSETAIKDIGLVGGALGWTIVVGGACGFAPRLAKQLTDVEVTTDQAMEIVQKLIDWFEKNAHEGERLGDVVGRLGIGACRTAVGA